MTTPSSRRRIPSWVKNRNVLGIVIGAVSLPFLVLLGHNIFSALGVPEFPVDEGAAEQEAFIQSLSFLEKISVVVAHTGGTFLAACIAMIIVKTKKRYPGLIIGGFGLLLGALNDIDIPGVPIWMLALDLALYLPAGWAAANVVLKLKPRFL